MTSPAVLLSRLRTFGRPDLSRRLLRLGAQGFDLGALAAPVAAIVLRARVGRPADPWSYFLLLLLLPFAGAALGALLALFDRRSDLIQAARALDAAVDGKERALTAADSLARDAGSGPFLSLLIDDVARDLDRNLARFRPRESWRGPAWIRGAAALLLALLILVVPSGARGLLGEENLASGASAARQDLAAAGEAAAPGIAPADAFDGKVEVTVTTNRDVYLIGEEVHLRVKLRTLEPLPAGVALEVTLRVDGEKLLTLPIQWTLPEQPDEVLEAEVPMKADLQALGAYRVGLLTFDTYVRPVEEQPGLGGVAVANRWTIQIAENARKLKTPMPAPVEKKKEPKPEPKPPAEPKPEKKQDEKKPDQKKKPDQGAGPGEEPPAKINDKPFVIDPLFAGDQTEKREVKVFDRDREDAKNPPPPERKEGEGSRPYEKTRVAEIDELDLPGRERRLVRRYLESLGGTTK